VLPKFNLFRSLVDLFFFPFLFSFARSKTCFSPETLFEKPFIAVCGIIRPLGSLHALVGDSRYVIGFAPPNPRRVSSPVLNFPALWEAFGLSTIVEMPAASLLPFSMLRY